MSTLCKRRKRNYSHKHSVLKLNKAYQPIDVYTWEEAVKDFFNGRCEIVESYNDVMLHSGFNALTKEQIIMKCPSVVKMINSDVNGHHLIKNLPLTRKNILDRDKGCCAYCGEPLTVDTMTIDHVYPVSRGGLTDWVNCRAACSKCNLLKADKTLHELGWKLRSRVGIPTLTKDAPKSIILKIGGKIPDESWRRYIYWEVKTKEKIRDI